uniref:Uncharacterized protein n=1 Tax=Rhizophora mucronata TaxID=61149 RepID=A0A2P2QZ75_RHIMU
MNFVTALGFGKRIYTPCSQTQFFCAMQKTSRPVFSGLFIQPINQMNEDNK